MSMAAQPSVETPNVPARTARSWCPSRLPLFSYGFRPFFLLAGLAAPLALVVWLLTLAGQLVPGGTIPPQAWHIHEMLFGFVAAAIAGFLLTAVPSWTGTKALSGKPLMGLVIVWLAGRIASWPAFADTLPATLIDVAFFPALAMALLVPLIRARRAQNVMFLVLLALLTLSNVMMRLDWLGITENAGEPALALINAVVLMMVVVIGGRIIPAFTRNALRARGDEIEVVAPAGLSRLALALTVMVGAADLLLPGSQVAGFVALAAAAAHLVRLLFWRTDRVLRDPLLWVLHLGYGWVVLALLLKGLWLVFGFEAGMAWQHALTTGAFATMILAVMSRASLGHTGRALKAAPLTIAAYVTLTMAGLLRIAAPLLPADSYGLALALAGGMWVLTFGLFIAVYGPILIGPHATLRR